MHKHILLGILILLLILGSFFFMRDTDQAVSERFSNFGFKNDVVERNEPREEADTVEGPEDAVLTIPEQENDSKYTYTDNEGVGSDQYWSNENDSDTNSYISQNFPQNGQDTEADNQVPPPGSLYYGYQMGFEDGTSVEDIPYVPPTIVTSTSTISGKQCKDGTTVPFGSTCYQTCSTGIKIPEYESCSNAVWGTTTPKKTVTPTPPYTIPAGCVVKDVASQFPLWTPQLNSVYSGAPLHTMGKDETFAFKLQEDQLISKEDGRGMVQMYNASAPFTFSVTKEPCQFSDTPRDSKGYVFCQTTSDGGPLRFYTPGSKHSNILADHGSYCKLPALSSGQDTYYINVRFADRTTGIVNPEKSTCMSESGTCTFLLLFQNSN